MESALNSYAVAIAMVRDEGLTRRRQTDATERFFALCFALEQMRRNFCGLIRRGREWARSPDQMSYATAYRAIDFFATRHLRSFTMLDGSTSSLLDRLLKTNPWPMVGDSQKHQNSLGMRSMCGRGLACG